MTNKMKYKIMCIILTMTLIILPIRVQASQSRSSYFNKSYTLTSSQAENLVAVAQAQLGKTKSQLRYTEAWCADFVSDCANLAGLSSKIPFDGYCETLYKKIKKAGGQDVSSPQKGDLVFYYCKYCPVHWCHVGIMTDSVNSIEGNYNGKVSSVRGHYSDGKHSTTSGVITKKFVRPAYSRQQPSFSVNLQNNATLSGTSYPIAGTVKNGGTYPGLHLYLDYDWVADTANNQYGNYAFYLDTTKYTNGKHLLGVKLTNEDGFDYTSWYTVYIKNNPQPSFTVNLQNNAILSGTSYPIAGTVKNGGTYPGLHLYLDYDWVADTANNQYGNYAFYLDTTKYTNGKHLLGVKLTNEDGFDYTSWYTVHIKNSKPKKVYYGDLDLNGKITVTDLSAIRSAIVGKITLTSDEKKRADVNGDGKITSTDALLIQRYISKEIDSFPVEH